MLAVLLVGGAPSPPTQSTTTALLIVPRLPFVAYCTCLTAGAVVAGVIAARLGRDRARIKKMWAEATKARSSLELAPGGMPQKAGSRRVELAEEPGRQRQGMTEEEATSYTKANSAAAWGTEGAVLGAGPASAAADFASAMGRVGPKGRSKLQNEALQDAEGVPEEAHGTPAADNEESVEPPNISSDNVRREGNASEEGEKEGSEKTPSGSSRMSDQATGNSKKEGGTALSSAQTKDIDGLEAAGIASGLCTDMMDAAACPQPLGDSLPGDSSKVDKQDKLNDSGSAAEAMSTTANEDQSSMAAEDGADLAAPAQRKGATTDLARQGESALDAAGSHDAVAAADELEASQGGRQSDGE